MEYMKRQATRVYLILEAQEKCMVIVFNCTTRNETIEIFVRKGFLFFNESI